MARFNKDAIEKPKLKDLPELPKQDDEPAEDAAAAAPAGGDEDLAQAAPAAEESDEADNADDSAAPADDSAQDQPDAGAEASASPDADEPQNGQESGQPKEDDETAKLEKLIAERKEIEKENERLQQEYDETVKNGEKRVTELNERFGDWYYVISDEVYKQIHLGRDQIIRKKEEPAEADADKATNGAGASDALSGLPNLPAAPPAREPAEQPAADNAAAAEAEAPGEPPAPTESQ
jgi:hypothetical protein